MNQYKSVFYVLLSGCLWGTTCIFVNYFDALGLTATQISFLRSFMAFLILLLFIGIRRPALFRIDLRDIWIFAGTGLVSLTMFNICYFTTISMSEVTIAVGLLYTSPVFVMFFATLIFHERVTAMKLIAVPLTVLGCFMISGIIGSGGIPVKTLLVGLGAGLFYGLYSIFGRFAVDKYDPLTTTFYTFLLSTIGLGVFCGLSDIPPIVFGTHAGPVTAAATSAAIGLSIKSITPVFVVIAIGIFPTIFPYVLYTAGLAKLEAGKAAVLATVEPVVTSLIGIFIYAEPHGPLKIMGMLCILLAAVVVNHKPADQKS